MGKRVPRLGFMLKPSLLSFSVTHLKGTVVIVHLCARVFSEINFRPCHLSNSTSENQRSRFILLSSPYWLPRGKSFDKWLNLSYPLAVRAFGPAQEMEME